MSQSYEAILLRGCEALSQWCEEERPRYLLPEFISAYAASHSRALYWQQELTGVVNEAHRLIVRRALAREGVPNPKEETIESLANSLPGELQNVLSELALSEVSAKELYEPTLLDGMFLLDAKAALVLEQRGGNELAQMIRAESSKRVASYLEALPNASPRGRSLCTPALWWLFSNAKLEEDGLPPFTLAIFVARLLVQQQNAKDPIPTKDEPTLAEPKTAERTITAEEANPKESVSTLHIDIAKIYSSTYKPQTVQLSDDCSQVLRNGEVIASVPSLPKDELALLQKGLHQIGSLTFRRAVNYLVRACWERHQQGETRPDRLTFQGIEEFSQLIGQPDNDHSKAIRMALLQGQCFFLEWPGGIIGGLWLYFYQKPRTGRKAFLEIELSRVLRPHFGMAELDSPWRVPVVQIAPMVGRNNEHAAQAALQERLMIELVDRRIELIKYGGARIIDQDWRRMAEEVGLPDKMLPSLLERWQHTDSDGEAFLEKNDQHYILAPTAPYRAAREFLLEAGRRTLAAKEAGKKGVVIRLSRINKKKTSKK